MRDADASDVSVAIALKLCGLWLAGGFQVLVQFQLDKLLLYLKIDLKSSLR